MENDSRITSRNTKMNQLKTSFLLQDGPPPDEHRQSHGPGLVSRTKERVMNTRNSLIGRRAMLGIKILDYVSDLVLLITLVNLIFTAPFVTVTLPKDSRAEGLVFGIFNGNSQDVPCFVEQLVSSDICSNSDSVNAGTAFQLDRLHPNPATHRGSGRSGPPLHQRLLARPHRDETAAYTLLGSRNRALQRRR